jgi:hypothetical protein
MEPENIRFGGGPSASVLHPLVAIAMILAIVLILCLKRKSLIIPVFLSIFLIPKGQQIVAAGLHFNVFRIIFLVVLARWFFTSRSSPLAGGFNFMDRIFTLWAISFFVMNSLQWMQVAVVIKLAGDFFDAMGGYFAIRYLIQDREDVRLAIKMLATVAIVNAVCMINEQRTGHDLFALLGGMIGETVRDGKIRSQGSFEIFITAGSFGATLPPLFIWLWTDGKAKLISMLGFIAAVVMAVTCYASTTLIAFAAGIGALCLWPIRKQMRPFRWGIVAALVGLHLIMKGPVWSLIEHIDLTGSSSSYHRYQLIDTFIRHFSDWWLVGTSNNASWGWEMWDTSNQYVTYGLAGGLLTFVLFIGIISRGFGSLGTARKVVDGNKKEEWFLWCLGATMFAHVVAYFGIGYFDQVQFSWFALLAIISVAVAEATASSVPLVEEAATPRPRLGRVLKLDKMQTNH